MGPAVFQSNFTSCLPGTYFLPPGRNKEFPGQCPFPAPTGPLVQVHGTAKAAAATTLQCLPRRHHCDRKGMHTPTPCPAGRYGMATGLFTASCSGECSPGYYCPVQSTSRTAFACPPGRYRGNTSAQSADDCRPCGVGLRCVNQLYAVPCAAGNYSDMSNATTCKVCPAGWYSMSGSAGCTQCNTGRYQDEPGQAFCLPCVPGTYSTALARDTQCDACPQGFFTRTTALTSCTKCEMGRSTSAESSTTCFEVPPGEANGQECAAGSFCAGGAAPQEPCTPGRYSNRAGSPSVCSAFPEHTPPQTGPPCAQTAPLGSQRPNQALARASYAKPELTHQSSRLRALVPSPHIVKCSLQVGD